MRIVLDRDFLQHNRKSLQQNPQTRDVQTRPWQQGLLYAGVPQNELPF